MNTKIIIGAVVTAAVVVGGYSYISNNMNKKEIMMKGEEAKKMEMMKIEEIKVSEEKMKMEKEAMMKEEEIMDKKMDAPKGGEDKMMKDEKGAMMQKSGSYIAYSPEKIAMAASGDVVLFFRASWCPKCRTTDADIKANLKNIPANVTILDVDYDKYADLKVKYGVTSQHTFVQVDTSGKAIGKWSGSRTLSELVSNIK